MFSVSVSYTPNDNLRYNPNFGALKKSSLTPFKRAYCEMYHPPLEKMNKVADLTDWVEAAYQKIQQPLSQVGIEQELIPWREGLKNLDVARHRNSVYWKHLIYENLVRLKTSYLAYFDMDTLVKTITDIKSNLTPKGDPFNFYKHYTNHMKDNALVRYFGDNIRTGWLEFIGSSDNVKQAQQVKDIQALSLGSNWCTIGRFFSKLAIEDESCAFYIYLKEGKTLYGVRTVKNLTQEIKDQHNVSIDLPEKYFKSLKELNSNIQVWKNAESMLTD